MRLTFQRQDIHEKTVFIIKLASSSCMKPVKIRLDETWYLQTCCKLFQQQLASSLWTKCPDNHRSKRCEHINLMTAMQQAWLAAYCAYKFTPLIIWLLVKWLTRIRIKLKEVAVKLIPYLILDRLHYAEYTVFSFFACIPYSTNYNARSTILHSSSPEYWQGST